MSKLDFFTPQVDIEKLHPNFISIHPSATGGTLDVPDIHEPTRLIINNWADGFPDRDGKIVKQFQETFNSTFWEIYLHELFKKSGAKFYWDNSAPDFHISLNNQELIIEASIAEEAKGSKAEWEENPITSNQHIDIDKLNKQAMVRLLGTITSKIKKYRRSYQTLPHVAGKPFLLAINGFEQPGFFLKADRPMRAILYNDYVDEEVYKRAPHSHPLGPPSTQLNYVSKNENTNLDLGIFLNEDFSDISAIIHNPVATVTKATIQGFQQYPEIIPIKTKTIISPSYANATGQPLPLENYRESIFDGLQVYHNPFAKYPLNDSTFNFPGVTHYSFDKNTLINHVGGVNNALISRTLMNLRILS